jgi:hypothetical protein
MKVQVRAFTGMVIGTFEVVGETKDSIEVVTKKGDKLIFDKATGLQANANNPKFANRVECDPRRCKSCKFMTKSGITAARSGFCSKSASKDHPEGMLKGYNTRACSEYEDR